MSRMSLPAVALIAFALPAAAQDRPLTDAEIMDLARREAVWCENWREGTRDCDSLYMLRQREDGTLEQSGMIVLSESPEMRVRVSEAVRLENGRLCSTGAVEDLDIQATLAGRPSPETALLFRALLSESMAAFAEAEICQQLMATGDPETLAEVITADGERLRDFESTYRLGTFDTGFLLRPLMEEADEDGQAPL